MATSRGFPAALPTKLPKAPESPSEASEGSPTSQTTMLRQKWQVALKLRSDAALGAFPACSPLALTLLEPCTPSLVCSQPLKAPRQDWPGLG